MTVTELSNEFDILWNNIMSNMAPNLDDYEKSVFLTKALEEIVIKLYSNDGFEDTELNRRYLAPLLDRTVVTNIPTPTLQGSFLEYDITLNSNLLVLVSELAYILSSSCCGNDTTTKAVNVVPIKYDELNKVIQNPFKRPNNRQVLRLDKSQNEVYIITTNKNGLQKYIYEYIKRPSPIILIDLSTSGLTIDGSTTLQTSILNPSLHRTILQYAVQLALISWASNNKN